MPSFLACIDLRDAAASDYEPITTRLESLGFSRTIRADDGRIHELGTGKYVGTGDGTTLQVRDLITQVAAETGKAFGILVVECQGASWLGLPVVQGASAPSASMPGSSAPAEEAAPPKPAGGRKK